MDEPKEVKEEVSKTEIVEETQEVVSEEKEEPKTFTGDDIKGLTSALEKERTDRKNLEKRLKDIEKAETERKKKEELKGKSEAEKIAFEKAEIEKERDMLKNKVVLRETVEASEIPVEYHSKISAILEGVHPDILPDRIEMLNELIKSFKSSSEKAALPRPQMGASTSGKQVMTEDQLTYCRKNGIPPERFMENPDVFIKHMKQTKGG